MAENCHSGKYVHDDQVWCIHLVPDDLKMMHLIRKHSCFGKQFNYEVFSVVNILIFFHRILYSNHFCYPIDPLFKLVACNIQEDIKNDGNTYPLSHDFKLLSLFIVSTPAVSFAGVYIGLEQSYRYAVAG